MQVTPRHSVVTEVGEGPGLQVEVVRPIWLASSGVENREADSSFRWRSAVAKPAPVSDAWYEFGNGVIPDVAVRPTSVNAVNDEIGRT